jgi:hypothetical protein
MSRPFLVCTDLTCFHCPVEERPEYFWCASPNTAVMASSYMASPTLAEKQETLIEKQENLVVTSGTTPLEICILLSKKKESWKMFSTQSLIEGSDSILVLAIGLKYLLVSKRDALFQNAAVAQYTDASYAEFIFALQLAWSNGTLKTHLFTRHQSNHHLLRSQEIKTHLFKRHQPNHLSLCQKHLTQMPVHT